VVFADQRALLDSTNAGGDFTLVAASGRGCYVLHYSGFEIAPCAAAEIDLISGRGFGADVPQSNSGRWVTALAGGLAEWAIRRWVALRLSADATAPLSRPVFALEGLGAVHRPAVIGFRGALGAELRFF
jgi:hypothetical protein